MTAMMRTVSILYTGVYFSLCQFTHCGKQFWFWKHFIEILYLFFKKLLRKNFKFFGKIFISATGSHMTRSVPCIQVTDFRIFRQDNQMFTITLLPGKYYRLTIQFQFYYNKVVVDDIAQVKVRIIEILNITDFIADIAHIFGCYHLTLEIHNLKFHDWLILILGRLKNLQTIYIQLLETSSSR